MLEPIEEPVRCIIFYRALVKVVELYVDGTMTHGDDASALSKGGWSFKIEEGERIRAIASATALEDRMLTVPEIEEQGDEGLTRQKEVDKSYCLYDGRDRKEYKIHRLGLKPDEVRLALLKDDAVFNIVRPEELMKQPLFTQQQESSRDAAQPLPADKDKSKAVNSFTLHV